MFDNKFNSKHHTYDYLDARNLVPARKLLVRTAIFAASLIVINVQASANTACIDGYDLSCYQQTETKVYGTLQSPVFKNADAVLSSQHINNLTANPVNKKQISDMHTSSTIKVIPYRNDVVLVDSYVEQLNNNLTVENLEVLKTFYQGASLDYDVHEVAEANAELHEITATPSAPSVINLQTLKEFYNSVDESDLMLKQTEHQEQTQALSAFEKIKGFFKSIGFSGLKKNK